MLQPMQLAKADKDALLLVFSDAKWKGILYTEYGSVRLCACSYGYMSAPTHVHSIVTTLDIILFQWCGHETIYCTVVFLILEFACSPFVFRPSRSVSVLEREAQVDKSNPPTNSRTAYCSSTLY